MNDFPKDFTELQATMKSGSQSSGVSFWQHGEQVVERYRDLMNPIQKLHWKLPKWFIDNADWIRDNLRPITYKLSTYQLWHDCGKPLCRTVDSEGKVHYPNHAEVSAKIWRQLGGCEEIAELISQDMLCHTLKPAEAKEFAKHPNALPLLVTALCEVHANATMFGGFSSESFCIKSKRLEKCGNIILKELCESI